MQNLLARVSLKRIRENAKEVALYSKKPLIAVVKDDAYGHGAVQVTHVLSDMVRAFAVSTVEEGAALRTAGIAEDVLVLTPPLSEEDVLRASAYSLMLSVSCDACLNLILRSPFVAPLRVHFAVNTGMNRYGFRLSRLRGALERAKRAGITVEGVYSHYFCPEDAREREAQRTVFESAAELAREYFPHCMRHIAATGGVLAGGELYDAVRVGIALYGYFPQGFERALQIRPAMKFYAPVSHSCTFAGGGAGYNRAEKQYKKLHTLRLGYGDGFFRAGGIGVGKLCMDACVREGRGDFGRMRLVLKDVSEYARAMNTTEYEALVRLGERAVKVYDGV